MSEFSEKKHFFKDRCWASAISAAGGLAAIGAANAIVKKKYAKAAVLSTVSAGVDFFVGKEARRFAKRRPEEAQKRAARGAIEDQFWDKVRNTFIGGALLTVEKLPPKVKLALAAVVLKETVTLAIGTKAIVDHKRANGGGWPAVIPSTPTGKETMLEFGAGLAVGALSASIGENSPTTANTLENTAIVLCLTGVARGLQTAPEYMRAKNEMDLLSSEEQLAYEPDFYKPHIGTTILNFVRGTAQQPKQQDFMFGGTVDPDQLLRM